MSGLRVCLVSAYDFIEKGGVKKHVVQLAAELRKGGDHVDIAGPYSGSAELPEGMYGFRGVMNFPSNGSDNLIGIGVNPFKVRALLSRGRYDVLHIHEPAVPMLSWWLSWLSPGIAKVCTFHAFAETESSLSQTARRMLVAPELRFYDRAIAVSPAAARFAKVAWSRPLAIIPNGLDTRAFTPRTGERQPGPVRLLFVGRFRDPRKGLPTLLQAFAKARAAGADVVLDVVGEGNPAILGPLPEGVTLLGILQGEDALANAYRGCDVFVAPSMGGESFGIVLLEAMASRLPIACSSIEGYAAVAPKDGALLTPPGDVDGLAAALVTLAADPARRERMADVNLAASVDYDWSRLADRVREEYRLAIAQKRG
jgi:phosphatidylinositol alpha-mannosyltransferase